MTHTKEKIQAARDDLTPLTAYCPDHFDESTGCQVDCAMFIRDHIETLRTLLDEAISKMETVEKSSVDPFDYQRVKDWALSNPRKPANQSFTDSTNRQVAYLIEDLQPAVDVEELLYEITAHIKEKHDRETSLRYMPCVAVVLSYLTAHYTLTKREGV